LFTRVEQEEIISIYQVKGIKKVFFFKKIRMVFLFCFVFLVLYLKD